MTGSVENEWLCGRIAAGLGLETATSEIARFGDVTALVVERFDRKKAEGGKKILRIPQEDFCQVTGTPSARKYESDGGPGMETIMRFLLGSREAAKDRETFFTYQVLFWLLAAPDGHAKNFSIIIERGGRFRLTPLYDIMSAYPVLGHGRGLIPPEKLKLAMSFKGKNRQYGWGRIGPRYIRETARLCGFKGTIDAVIERLLAGIPNTLREIAGSLPDGFPTTISEPIFRGVEDRMRLLKNE